MSFDDKSLMRPVKIMREGIAAKPARPARDGGEEEANRAGKVP
jgi:hypothetical protein